MDLRNYALYEDGSGIAEGVNILTGDVVIVKDWVFIEPLKDDKKSDA